MEGVLKEVAQEGLGRFGTAPAPTNRWSPLPVKKDKESVVTTLGIHSHNWSIWVSYEVRNQPIDPDTYKQLTL